MTALLADSFAIRADNGAVAAGLLTFQTDDRTVHAKSASNAKLRSRCAALKAGLLTIKADNAYAVLTNVAGVAPERTAFRTNAVAFQTQLCTFAACFAAPAKGI